MLGHCFFLYKSQGTNCRENFTPKEMFPVTFFILDCNITNLVDIYLREQLYRVNLMYIHVFESHYTLNRVIIHTYR